MLSCSCKFLLLLSLCLFINKTITAQTQDDFNNRLSEVYTNAADKKKALTLAKELYNMVEKRKELQTYANYYLLKNIFENQAPDITLAKAASDKATKILSGAGTSANPADTTANPFNQWYYNIYPSLFTNKDPDIGNKALGFIERYPEYKGYDSYYYIAYAFERLGDFVAAKENYEKAMRLDTGNSTTSYHSYLFYTNFLSKSGDYLKAEEQIAKMERLAQTGIEFFREAYKAETMGAKVVYYLNIGDFHSYIKAAEENNAYSAKLWHKNNTTPCDPYPGVHYTTSAFGREMLKQYDEAERLWKTRDSVNYVWVKCHNQSWPNNQYFPVSMYPVYLAKRGKLSKLSQPASFYIKETEAHYGSYSQYADISVNFMKAVQLAWLGSDHIDDLFKPLIAQVKNNRNFRESTLPISNYAYFNMRGRKLDAARASYADLFNVNIGWINDVIFSFGEKAFVTYYNAKLKEGYENFHSFVKLAKDKQLPFFPELSRQAYNNLLFTKSISLKGIEKRKDAFVNTNDKNITQLYEQWLDKKQQLIRQYLKADQPGTPDTASKVNQEQLNALQDEVNHLENELTTKAKDFKKYLKIIPPDWTTVRDNLKDNEAAVEMIRFEWRDQVYYSDTVYYAAYIITRASKYPEVVYLKDAATDLENRYYKQYKNAIRLKMDDKESYNHFWKPVSDYLASLPNGRNIHKIFFSPDGIYHLVNIPTLKNQESGKYLLDEMEISYTASASDGPSAKENKPIKTAVLIGRPMYETGIASTVAIADKNTRSLVKSFKDIKPTDLPGTEEEILSIGKAMKEHNIAVTYYLKADATEDKMYQLHSPDVLHIATHGFWSPSGTNATEGYRTFNAMANSGLLFSGVVNYYSLPVYPDTYDGILTAYEAQTLDLKNTSLVVLSACETGLGDLDAGEGVYGLQRAFLAAGADVVMISLWKVDDAATRDFMTAFNNYLLENNDSRSAFTSAQKAMLQKYKQPYFWGAFKMVGK